MAQSKKAPARKMKAHAKSNVTWTKVDQQGRVVIPADLREQFGIEPGKSIAFLVEDGRLSLMTVKQGIERAQRIFRESVYIEPGRSIVDEFIADKRAEEEREFLD
jgi:AbrB family looped-hinge helix DNA binding protein